MNWLKRKKEERLRTRIALNAGYGVNDLNAVYEFVKGESVPSESKLNFTDKFGTTVDGGLIATAVDGRMTFIDGSFCDNIKRNKDMASSGSGFYDNSRVCLSGTLFVKNTKCDKVE